MRGTLTIVAVIAACAVPPVRAQQQDTAYARLVREYTTDARFLPASVKSLPASASIPSPSRYFGTIVGAPGVMHHASEVYGYFRALAKATPRVRVETLGTSEGGREMILVIIADDTTMQHLGEYRARMATLADPRLLPRGPDSVLARAKPIYYLNGGLHSTEMGSPEMLMELAYRLAAGTDSAITGIRDRVITIINPVSEPDGRDRAVDWYYRYTKGRAEWDDGFPRSPPYWGKYVFHDNNRDGLQITQALTKAIFGVYYAWHPLVMHDLHESVPLLYISTGTGPYNETNDPIIVSEWQLLANSDITALSAQGLPGVWTWGFFDGWWPGYAMWVANNHNAIGRFYETFGNAGADTYVRDLSRESYAGAPVTSRQWYRSWPPTKKVRWSLRDNVNYQEAGVLASLALTARDAPALLRDFWQVGVNSITRGRTTAPYAYVIPAFTRQRDAGQTAYLVNQLLRQHIEVHQRAVGDSAGDFVVLLDQPYRDLAVNLLAAQHYPEKAQYPPYDDIAWTLGDLYGVTVRAVKDSAALHWPGLTVVSHTVAAPGSVRGAGGVYLLPYRAQNAVIEALYAVRGNRKSGIGKALAGVWSAGHRFVVGTDSFPAGSLIFEGLSATAARGLAARYGLPLVAVATVPPVAKQAVVLPRVAIYRVWYDTQDEGWARYTFEHYGIPYTSIDKDDLCRGGLRRRFDVILVPNVRGSVDRLIHGIDRRFGPLPFTKTARTPSFGQPASSPDITGGPGFAGMAELERFVDDGGTLITLGSATRLAAETGIAPNLSPHATRTLFHPGSVVRVRQRGAGSPLLFGYPDTTTVFRGNGPLYQVAPRDSAMLVLQYGTKLPEHKDEGPMLGIADTVHRATGDSAARTSSAKEKGTKEPAYVVSGMVRGQDEIIGQGAIFDVPVRAGRVIAFTFDPLHRFLNQHEFPMVWNALLHWNDPTGAAAK